MGTEILASYSVLRTQASQFSFAVASPFPRPFRSGSFVVSIPSSLVSLSTPLLIGTASFGIIVIASVAGCTASS